MYSQLKTLEGGIPFRQVELSFTDSEQDCPPGDLLAWQQTLNAAAEFLSGKPAGTVLVAPLMGMGYFLAQDDSGTADLWCTDWSEDEGLRWDSFTEKACDKHFVSEDWARHFTTQLRTVLLSPRKELEFVAGLRVVMRPSLVASLCGEPVTLL